MPSSKEVSNKAMVFCAPHKITECFYLSKFPNDKSCGNEYSNVEGNMQEIYRKWERRLLA